MKIIRWTTALSLLTASALILFAAGPASAVPGIIYNNGAVNTFVQSFYSDTNQYDQTLSAYEVLADDFILNPGSTTITDVHWWGQYGNVLISEGTTCFPGTPPWLCDSSPPEYSNPIIPPASEVFEINIYSFDTSGIPLVTPTHTRTVTDPTRNYISSNYDTWEYDAIIDPITLDADTNYLISIIGKNDIYNPDLVWAWRQTLEGPKDGLYGIDSYNFPGPDWTLFVDYDLAFYLTGPTAVPEPSTLLLLGTGLLGLAGIRRKFKV